MTLLLSLLLFFSAMTDSTEIDYHSRYKIIDTRTGQTATLSDISEAMKTRQVLFLGEEHNDKVAHVVQDSLYKLLLKDHGKVAASMEMFERDVQGVVNEYLSGYITEAQMMKDARAWNNYKSDYRPVLEAAKNAQQSVIAANAARRYANLVSRNGLDALKDLDKTSKRNFAKLPLDTTNTAYFEKFVGLMGGAEHFKNRNIYFAQVLWDATMAESIHQFWKKNKKHKVYHLNGRFHSDEGLGTVSQLKKLNKKQKTLVLSAFPVKDFATADWEEYRALGDFIILTDASVPKSY